MSTHCSAARRSAQRTGFTLVEIMIVVLIIGILLAIAVPSFINARESSRAKACVGSLSEINSAKSECIMDNKISGTDTTSTFYIDASTPASGNNYQLVGASSYLKNVPACPSGGSYATGTVMQTPWCSISSSAANTPIANSNYGYQGNVPGRFYHGL